MHAIRKLTNSPIRGDPWVVIAPVEAIPTIPIDRAEGRASGPRLLSATGLSHTAALLHDVRRRVCVTALRSGSTKPTSPTVPSC